MVFLNNAHRGANAPVEGQAHPPTACFSHIPFFLSPPFYAIFFTKTVLRLLAVSIHFSPEIPSKTEGFVRSHNHQHINLLQGAARKGA